MLASRDSSNQVSPSSLFTRQKSEVQGKVLKKHLSLISQTLVMFHSSVSKSKLVIVRASLA